MAIQKSSWNGPRAFSHGKPFKFGSARVGANTKRSSFNTSLGIKMSRDDSHTMQARQAKRSSGTRKVDSRHPDAAPKIRFLHMN